MINRKLRSKFIKNTFNKGFSLTKILKIIAIWKRVLPQLFLELLPESGYIVHAPIELDTNEVEVFSGKIKAYFAAFLGKEMAETHWQLPPDYTEFLRLGLRLTQGEEELYEDIYSIDQVLNSTTEPWYAWMMDELKQRKATQKLTRFDSIWLNIGWWGDKHEYFICCDHAHESYGNVFDCHDCTPWGTDGAYITDSFDSFTDFLKEKLGKDEGWY